MISTRQILISVVVVTLALAAVFVGHGRLDVVADRSATAFGEVLDAAEANGPIEQVTYDDGSEAWVLNASDGSASLTWSSSAAELEFAVQPFVDAGLDVGRLPAGMVQNGQVKVARQFAAGGPDYDAATTPQGSYRSIVRSSREAISYHAELGHFGLDLGSGNMFEWAGDITSNDKDIVFVEPIFIDAGRIRRRWTAGSTRK